LEENLENAHKYNLRGEELILLPEKAVYIKKHKTLLAADLHLGKSSLFRKEGIPVPAELANAELETLAVIIDKFKPDRLIIVGDLFHADANLDFILFENWRKGFKSLNIDLIRGNHDILADEEYNSLNIQIHNEHLLFSKFFLTHKPEKKLENKSNYHYIISAHVHPAVRLKGKGKQFVTLPCFYFGKNYGLLPAFGRFTGRALVHPGVDDNVFVILESGGTSKVIPVR
jgi:DNA ligase-associated metallophosphoesterase